MKAYKRFFDLGYINYSGSTIKNKVTAEVSLKENGTFSASLYVWTCNKKTGLEGGQCFYQLQRLIHNPIFDTIFKFWKRWHLNAIHAGLMVQEEALEKVGLANAYYTVQVDHLKKVGLYEVPITQLKKSREILPSYFKKDTYCYGEAWIKRIIPRKELTEIRKLFKSECAYLTEQEALA